MATTQEGRHAGFVTLGGSGTFNEAAMSGMKADESSASSNVFNERMLQWINAALSASHTNINAAMQAYATSKSVTNWSSLNTVD
jgi:hypothetical protein